MKTKTIMLVLCALMMCLVACEQNAPKDPNKPDVNKDPNAPQLSMNEISTTPSGGKYQICVTSKTVWIAESNKEWVTLDMDMWIGDTIINITVTDGINNDTALVVFNNKAGKQYLIVYRTVQGKANGGFSIAENKQVKFAPGNLQYQPSTETWRFAEHQYDFVGEDNDSLFYSSYSGWIDLFGWGTGNNPTNTSTDYNDYSTFVDWGTNKIGLYAANTWRTLSAEEWEYLFERRPYARYLFSNSATVHGQHGIIVIPDNTLAPVSFKSLRTCSSTDWEILESVGALFLPYAGVRYSTGIFEECKYWSSTPSYGAAAYLHFSPLINSVSLYYINRSVGLPVRLAQDL